MGQWRHRRNLPVGRCAFQKLGFPELPEFSAARISEGIQHTIYHNMLAPIVIYFGLAFVAFRNIRLSRKEKEEHQ